MSYVDALFDRDQDIIRVVERKDGKREYREYQAKYTFYFKDARGKYKSVYGDPLTRVVCKNTKDFRKEVAINKSKELFESDINPIFQCLSENYLNQDAPKLNIAFWDIETDFDPERGFAPVEDPFMPITAITVKNNIDNKFYVWGLGEWRDHNSELKKELVDRVVYVQCDKEAGLLMKFLDHWCKNYPDVLTGWNSRLFEGGLTPQFRKSYWLAITK